MTTTSEEVWHTQSQLQEAKQLLQEESLKTEARFHCNEPKN